MKVLLFSVILSCLFFGYGTKKYTIELKEEKSYGGAETNIIGFVTDFSYEAGKLYIYDQQGKAIFIFKVDGTLLKRIPLTLGKGPGEISMFTICMAVNEKYIALGEQLSGKIAFYNSMDGKYIKSVFIKTMPFTMFFKNNKLYVNSEGKDKIIHIYDYDGNKVGEIIEPFKSNDKRVTYPHVLAMDNDDNSFYIFSPYSAEIMKWKAKALWSSNYDKYNLVSPPVVRERNGYISVYSTRGWASAC